MIKNQYFGMSKHRLRMYGAKQGSLQKIIYLQSQSLIPETLYFCLHLIKKKNKETGDDKNVEQKWMENQRKADERLLARSNIKCQWNEQPCATQSQRRPESPFSILFHSRRVLIIPGGWPGAV